MYPDFLQTTFGDNVRTTSRRRGRRALAHPRSVFVVLHGTRGNKSGGSRPPSSQRRLGTGPTELYCWFPVLVVFHYNEPSLEVVSPAEFDERFEVPSSSRVYFPVQVENVTRILRNFK